jgi:hypothetical protein
LRVESLGTTIRRFPYRIATATGTHDVDLKAFLEDVGTRSHSLRHSQLPSCRRARLEVVERNASDSFRQYHVATNLPYVLHIDTWYHLPVTESSN